ncbi:MULTISPECIES: ADP-ribosyltransferase domain-containing protein [Streptomyces]|uniref:ADP-ribosyltransferase domain-containing protein n=1 Tax=Streptomyces TaxID=1883 RepID=UPI00240E4A12|nr:MULTISPECIES: ADP-ribosyltransferase domain-containing protein [Streptomyces]WFB88519.1 ADP-ribosyltransferase domain-containing protein [Streptomyces olivaceus]WGK50661.1 ADP-ribosyltransferase domain-containing protein [Streptomyces sp. B146]
MEGRSGGAVPAGSLGSVHDGCVVEAVNTLGPVLDDLPPTDRAVLVAHITRQVQEFLSSNRSSWMAEAVRLRSGIGDTTDYTLNLTETAEPTPETSGFAARALAFRGEDGGIHLHHDGVVVSVPRHAAGLDTEFGQQQAMTSDMLAAHLLAAATRQLEKSRPEDFDELLARARRLMDGRHRTLALRDDLPEDELRRQETLRNIQLIVAHQLYLDRRSDEGARSRNALLVSEWFRKQFRTEHTEGFHVPAGGPLSKIFKRETRGLSSGDAEAGTSKAGTLVRPRDLSHTRFTWLDVTDWRKVGGQLGSNPGGTYLDQHGKKFYVKLAQTGDHARNEVLAAELYRISGVSVPALQLVMYRGSPGTASPIVEGALSDLQQRLKNDSGYRKVVQSGFAVDAWLANWDVVGAVFDNIVSSQHNDPVRIDTGGALLFRATGDPKGDSFGPQADEWKSLRDERINPQSAWLFSGMSSRKMKDSAGRVVSVRPEQVDATVDAIGFDPAMSARLKEVLRARRLDIAARAGIKIAETEGISEAPEQVPPAETRFYGNPSFQSSAEDRARFSRAFRLYDRYLPRVQQLTASHRSLRSIPQEDLIALLGYTGNAYFDVVNKGLREQDAELLERYDAHIRGIVSGLNKLPVHKGSVTRAIEIYTTSELKQVVARYKVGTTIEEKSFVSTDAVTVARPGNVIFKIESLTGRRVDLLSEYQGTETEVLFPPGTRFRVTKNSKKGTDYHISMVEVAATYAAPHPSRAPGIGASTSFHQPAVQGAARGHTFASWQGPAVTAPSASQALAMVNQTAAAPQPSVQTLSEQVGRMGLEAPRESEARTSAHAPVDQAAAERWRESFSWARHTVAGLAHREQLLASAAAIVDRYHREPPAAQSGLSANARAHRDLYSDIVHVVAAWLHTDRHLPQPAYRAASTAQQAADEFGTGRRSAASASRHPQVFMTLAPPASGLARLQQGMLRKRLAELQAGSPEHRRVLKVLNTWTPEGTKPTTEEQGIRQPQTTPFWQSPAHTKLPLDRAAGKRSAWKAPEQLPPAFGGRAAEHVSANSLKHQHEVMTGPPAPLPRTDSLPAVTEPREDSGHGEPVGDGEREVFFTGTADAQAPPGVHDRLDSRTVARIGPAARADNDYPKVSADARREWYETFAEAESGSVGHRASQDAPLRSPLLSQPSNDVPEPVPSDGGDMGVLRQEPAEASAAYQDTATGEPNTVLRLRGGGPGRSESERDIVDHWIAESDRLGRGRSAKLQDIDRAVEAWVTGGRDHLLAFEENKRELEAIDLAIGAWLAEPHGTARKAAVERLRQRVLQELAASDRLSHSFPYLTDPEYRTNYEERQLFRTGFADYDLHRRQMPSGNYLKRIPEEDLVALIAYTGITEFSAVNQALRTGDRRKLAGYAPLIKSSVSGLNQLPPHTGTVYRGISLNPAETRVALARYTPGRVVQEPAFVSTNAFARRFSGNIQFKIESRSGRSIQAISRHKNVENEVLFAPGTSFQVRSVHDRDGIWTIGMTEVAPAQDPPSAAEPSPLVRQSGILPWVDASGWRKIGEKLGSNVGGTYEDAGGHRFYLKLARTQDHARNEVLAAALYRLAGVDVPELHLITREGRHGTASRFIENANQDLERNIKSKSYRKAIYSGFAVDAWLANWDVAGRYYDNIVNVDGNPVRIDTGGALMYSGKGEPKGNRFASSVTEWSKLRDYATNPQTFEVFKDITAKAMQESARRVIAITPEKIDAAIDSVGFGERTAAYLKTTLKARRVDVARLAGLPLPMEGAGPAERIPAAAPAPSSRFTGTPSQYRGPQAPLTASQMLAMVNRQPAEPSTDVPALTQQFSHVDLNRTNAGIESPQASGSRVPAYPLVDRTLLEQWRRRFSEERTAVRGLTDGQTWLTTAAHLVARDHVAPPPLGSTMSAPERAYQELYSDIVFAVAAQLHKDRALRRPQDRAHTLSLELGGTFGTLRPQAVPLRGTRTQQWSEPAPGTDSGERVGDDRGFGAATGFAGVEDSSRAMKVARDLIDVPAAVEQPLAARTEAARLIGLLLHDGVVAERVADSGVRVVIVPRSQRLTDLPPYADTRGEDRPPVSARGWTDQQRAVVAVSEENLLGQEAEDTDRTHPEGYSSVLHEAAHLVYAFGLEDAQRTRVEEVFGTRGDAAAPQQWVDGPLRDLHGNPSANHSSSDAAEYFAQSTVAYFGANHGRDAMTHQQRNNGAAWLAEHDPVLSSLLHELYGPPPAEPLHANALSVTDADRSMWEAFNWHTANTEGQTDSAGREPRSAADARQHSSDVSAGSRVTETVVPAEGRGPVRSGDTPHEPSSPRQVPSGLLGSPGRPLPATGPTAPTQESPVRVTAQAVARVLAAFDEDVRPALRVWDRPVTEEVDALQNITLKTWGARSLVFGVRPVSPVLVINVEGVLKWFDHGNLEPISAPVSADGPVVSLDLAGNGQLIGSRAQPAADSGARTAFCAVSIGADLSRVLGWHAPDTRPAGSNGGPRAQ